MAALAARCGTTREVVHFCSSCVLSSNNPASCSWTPAVALRVVGAIPSEVEVCSSLTTPQTELAPYVEVVLQMIQSVLSSQPTMVVSLAALTALQEWTQVCHVTLSQLHHPPHHAQPTLLALLVKLLSATPHKDDEEALVVAASKALTQALLVPTDTCTPPRQNAVSYLVKALEAGFITAPLNYATRHEWDSACHALSTCVCTLVVEEVDDICKQEPSQALIQILLGLQSHPMQPVTLPVLEVWLTIQEVPVAERHVHWTRPLFEKVVQVLLRRLEYPLDDDNYDETEFQELRRMVTDVLVSCYFLLRVTYVQHMVQCIAASASSPPSKEATLFGLHQVAREVCARLKARAGGASIKADRAATQQVLLELVQHLLSQPPSSSSLLVTRATCQFLGAYAPAWNVQCRPEEILHILAYLRRVQQEQSLTTTNNPSNNDDDKKKNNHAALATRSILVACSSILLQLPSQPQLVQSVHETLDVALASSGNLSADAVCAVAEGATRLLLQLSDSSCVQQSLGGLVTAVIQRASAALQQSVPGAAAATPEGAWEAVETNLRVLNTVLQFCDAPNEEQPQEHPLQQVISTVLWPFLEQLAPLTTSNEILLEQVLAIHRQLLRTAPTTLARFPETMQFVVSAFEHTKHPSTLDYIAGAVEAMAGSSRGGAAEEASFRDLLAHVTQILASYVTSTVRPHECPLLIKAYFELAQRYLLFSPAALLQCSQFGSLTAFAVDCLSACQGERESTRASCVYLTQLFFGWQALRLPPSSVTILERSSEQINEQFLLHGERVTQACIAGLASGPQMLWPSLADCLFALVHHVVVVGSPQQQQQPVVEDTNTATTVAHSWVYEATVRASNHPACSPETCQQVVEILFRLAREGPKSRGKAKMLLTDFAKISKGEMATDVLLSYAL